MIDHLTNTWWPVCALVINDDLWDWIQLEWYGEISYNNDVSIKPYNIRCTLLHEDEDDLQILFSSMQVYII